MLNNQQGFGTPMIGCCLLCSRTDRTGAPTDGSWSCPCRWPGNFGGCSQHSLVHSFKGSIAGKSHGKPVCVLSKMNDHHKLMQVSLTSWTWDLCKRWIHRSQLPSKKTRGELWLWSTAVIHLMARSRWPMDLDSDVSRPPLHYAAYTILSSSIDWLAPGI